VLVKCCTGENPAATTCCISYSKSVLPHQVVHHVCADVVVDLVEDAVVPVQGGQATAQVAPLLTPATAAATGQHKQA
jgi:hypothetical protein